MVYYDATGLAHVRRDRFHQQYRRCGINDRAAKLQCVTCGTRGSSHDDSVSTVRHQRELVDDGGHFYHARLSTAKN